MIDIYTLLDELDSLVDLYGKRCLEELASNNPTEARVYKVKQEILADIFGAIRKALDVQKSLDKIKEYEEQDFLDQCEMEQAE